MHPQIRQAGPGSLSDLRHGAGAGRRRPRTAAPNPELTDMTRRFWIGAALALPVLVLEMGGHFPGLGLHHLVSPQRLRVDSVRPGHAGRAVGRLAVLSCAAGRRFVNRRLNMFTPDRAWRSARPISTAWSRRSRRACSRQASAAWTASSPVYFEAAAVITVLVLLGQVLELRAREQTGGAIRALLDLAPKTARRICADGADEDVPLDAVQVGDRLRVRPGRSVPVDGVVLEGSSAVDEVDGDRRADAGRKRKPATR